MIIQKGTHLVFVVTFFPTGILLLTRGRRSISKQQTLPSKVVKFPLPDTLLSPEEFTAFLLQDVANLDGNMRISWMCLLAYSVSFLIACKNMCTTH